MNAPSMRLATSNTTTTSFKRVLIAFFAAFVFAIYPAATALATSLDDQIKALEREVQGYQAEAGRLRAEANTLQNAVAALNAQQSAIQTQINAKELELDQLKTKIVETEKRIINQETALARNLKSMYIESDTSTLEQVFSSKSISDYIDKAEYRNKIREGIQKTLQEIKTLKTALEKQKAEAEHVLADQKSMHSQLAAQENEKNNLLAQTQGQEATYQNIVGQKNTEIDKLRAQQRAANSRFIGAAGSGPACGGGYPGIWCNAPIDSMVDDWGMYNRECVSYTAFKVAASGRHMPHWGGRGNANQWPSSARADGIPVDGNPRVGDVAISMSGPYGHAMYVEAVHGGSITVSQYNVDWNGTYSTMTISSGGLHFIHF